MKGMGPIRNRDGQEAGAQDRLRLARLAATAAAGQWDPAQAIDWSRAPWVPPWVSREAVGFALSQLYHGELATARLCERLLDQVPEPEARRCLALQIADERRHAAVYRRYLEGLGGIAPVDPELAASLAAAAQAPGGPLSAMAAYHVVVEGENLRLQARITGFLPCPLLRRINRLIARDEARHLAFGRIYLARRLAGLPEAERRALRSWLQDLWRAAAESALRTRGRRNPLVRRFLEAWLARGWARHEAKLRQVGLAFAAEGEGAP